MTMRCGKLFLTGAVLFAFGIDSALAQPSITSGGVVNCASFTSPVVAGGTASIFGTNLAASATTDGPPGTLPVPFALAGTTVQIGNFAAPLYFVSPGQINVQIPWELAGLTQAFLTVTTAAGTSAPVAVSLAPHAPALLSASANGRGQGFILNSNNTFNGPTSPAPPDGTVEIVATDLGAVTNQPADGTASASAANTLAPVSVSIGGLPAKVTSAQLCGPPLFCFTGGTGLVSSYRITVQVPPNIPEGLAVPVVATMGGVSSNTVTMVVAFPGTVFEIPGLGCTTAYGYNRFTVTSWHYVTGTTSTSLFFDRIADDCTTRLFSLIAGQRALPAITVTQFDPASGQPLQLTTFQNADILTAQFGGNAMTGIPLIQESYQFSAKTYTVQ